MRWDQVSDMSEAYSREYRETAKRAARDWASLARGHLRRGLRPSYETPAEIRYLRIIGADLVGMSTAPETSWRITWE